MKQASQQEVNGESCLYVGWVRHRRLSPIEHRFSYPLFMCFLDLDDVREELGKRWFCSYESRNIVSFRCADYYQPSAGGQHNLKEPSQLKAHIIQSVQADANNHQLAIPNITKVCLLTNLRYFNFVFNPVTFYYCYDEDMKLCAVAAEITNTPWDERHIYIMHVGHSATNVQYTDKGKGRHSFGFQKAFHVSPFNPMSMDYRWVFGEPGQQCFVHMTCLAGSAEHSGRHRHFDASLRLQRRSIKDFGKVMIQFPVMCVSVLSRIYWQAFKLWLKRAPFYDHPKSKGVAKRETSIV